MKGATCSIICILVINFLKVDFFISRNRRKKVLRYSRKMHGGELWAKIEVLENVLSPLFEK